MVNAEATAASVVPFDVHCNHGTMLGPRHGKNMAKNFEFDHFNSLIALITLNQTQTLLRLRLNS